MEGKVHQDQVHHPASDTFSIIRVLLQPSAVYPRSLQEVPGEQAPQQIRLLGMSGTDIPQTEIKLREVLFRASLNFTITLLLTTKLTVIHHLTNLVPNQLIHRFNFNMLDLISGILIVHKNCHQEDFASGIKGS